MENDEVLIELGSTSLIVEIDGIRAEVRDATDIKSVKRGVATYLLGVIANLPQQKFYEKQQAQYGMAGGAVSGEGLVRANRSVNATRRA